MKTRPGSYSVRVLECADEGERKREGKGKRGVKGGEGGGDGGLRAGAEGADCSSIFVPLIA